MNYITIAVDAMGGDFGPEVVMPAVKQALIQNENLRVIIVGDEAKVKRYLSTSTFPRERVEIQHASEIVAMDELPAHALRSKKDSSMRVALNLVKEGKAQACVSAGNTGALMATARFVLKMIPGIDRPAIVKPLPSGDRDVFILDLGANVDCDPEHLLQFAIMGSVMVKAVRNIPRPRVGLLNIGSEDIKGNDLVKKATKLLADCAEINYIGYVEGTDIFKGTTDVVVCDGFVGNVALKTSEGLASMIGRLMKEAFTRNWYSKLAALIAMPVLKAFRSKIDPARYNGASFIGLQGVVIKSHGGADSRAFVYAIEQAMLEAEKRVNNRIEKEVVRLLEEETTA